MTAILKRELKAYFYSPIGYIFVGFFLLIGGIFFSLSNISYMVADIQNFFSSLSLVFLFLVPILTMRLLAEEIKNKVDQLLITAPISIFSIVLGKYLAAVGVFLAAMVVTVVYPVILLIFGNPGVGEIISSYIGFFLLGCSFIAVGLFISSITENQVIAAVASFGSLLVLWLMDWVISVINNPIMAQVLEWFSLLKRLNDFSIGILNFSSTVYYLSFICVFLFLTVQVIDKRRWS